MNLPIIIQRDDASHNRASHHRAITLRFLSASWLAFQPKLLPLSFDSPSSADVCRRHHFSFSLFSSFFFAFSFFRSFFSFLFSPTPFESLLLCVRSPLLKHHFQSAPSTFRRRLNPISSVQNHHVSWGTCGTTISQFLPMSLLTTSFKPSDAIYVGGSSSSSSSQRTFSMKERESERGKESVACNKARPPSPSIFYVKVSSGKRK